MPLYDFYCPTCHRIEERQCRVADRLTQRCYQDGDTLVVRPAPVYGKMAGQVVKGGGPDRFTADTMGIPLKELPEHLKADR